MKKIIIFSIFFATFRISASVIKEVLSKDRSMSFECKNFYCIFKKINKCEKVIVHVATMDANILEHFYMFSWLVKSGFVIGREITSEGILRVYNRQSSPKKDENEKLLFFFLKKRKEEINQKITFGACLNVGLFDESNLENWSGLIQKIGKI